MPTLVAGIDSSTQSCKVVVRNADTGALVRRGSAAHPQGTSVDPEAWWAALQTALDAAGGVDDVAAVSIGGQQHGMVCLDADGAVVRDAILWNDTRSARAARDLVDELPEGASGWADAVGSVPVASFTVTKLRWLADHEPDNAARTAAVCLPHDWLTWRWRGTGDIADLVTDRGDASGTGYWSPASEQYRTDIVELAFGSVPLLPTVLGPSDVAGHIGDVIVAPGTGDNAAAALGVAARPGDVIVSIGTSGVVSAVSAKPTSDASGIVAGFADATGAYLPLVCTLNASLVLDSMAALLRVSHEELSQLALSAPTGAGGLALVPYFDGERTPNRPEATGSLFGLRHDTATPAHLARAAVEGLLCGLADGIDALRAQGVTVERVLLVGGGSRSEAVRRIAPAVFATPVVVPAPGEYVADGAAKQAAWVLRGSADPPSWHQASVSHFEADAAPAVRDRYAQVRDLES